jgi:putative PIN family toxin of toxin-antitoxin system
MYCTEMMAELSEKLRETFGFSENHIQAVLYDIRRISERVDITGDVHVVTDDPDDDKFIECALVAKATAIVSGDHHLLELGNYEGITMLSAAEFLARFA